MLARANWPEFVTESGCSRSKLRWEAPTDRHVLVSTQNSFGVWPHGQPSVGWTKCLKVGTASRMCSGAAGASGRVFTLGDATILSAGTVTASSVCRRNASRSNPRYHLGGTGDEKGSCYGSVLNARPRGCRAERRKDYPGVCGRVPSPYAEVQHALVYRILRKVITPTVETP